jgi:hypothetical protein
MLSKVIWDTAVYWAVPGLLYFHDKWRHLTDLPEVLTHLARFSGTSKVVQRFLREWAASDTEHRDQAPFVRFYDFDFMPRLHVGMTAALDDTELQEQFEANIRFIDQLSGQMVATVLAEFDAEPDNLAKQQQAQKWRADDVLMSLVAVYEAERQANPVSDDWITFRPTAYADTGER